MSHRRAALHRFSGRLGRECPEPEQVWDAVEARGSAEGRRQIVDHIAECRACREAWRVAVMMGATPSRWKRAMRDLRDAIDGLVDRWRTA